MLKNVVIQHGLVRFGLRYIGSKFQSATMQPMLLVSFLFYYCMSHTNPTESSRLIRSAGSVLLL